MGNSVSAPPASHVAEKSVVHRAVGPASHVPQGQHLDIHDLLGRSDLQILQSSIHTPFPNVGGDVAQQVSAQLYSEGDYAAHDPLPTPMMTRYNRFQTFDPRGDPMVPDMEGYSRSTLAPASVRFAGSEEFMQRWPIDAVAPIPSIKNGFGASFVSEAGAYGYDRVRE